MLALLAAGQSRRFGDQDKLNAMLGDKMLGLHTAETLADLPFSRKLVIGSPRHDCATEWRKLGFEVIDNEQAADGQATSVRLAAAHAIQAGARALCIMLADMPFVTKGHVESLIAAFEKSGSTRTVASARREQAMPPAIFSTGALQSLTRLEGDSGARTLLADAWLVVGDDPVLLDIDTAEDLAMANGIYRQIK